MILFRNACIGSTTMKKTQEVITIKAKIVGGGGGWAVSREGTGGSWGTENTPFPDLGNRYTRDHFIIIISKL